ncbi:MAG: hypothetical protein EVA35_01335 [Candidatus Poseidoniales archaeon]|nr:MAG: hypothetical protein EVA35_01335 [Candidatus Poseidoniales archaeon]
MSLFECNIDARGKAVRLKLGIMAVVAGLVLAAVFYLAGIDLDIPWLIPLGIIGGGAFAIFEAWTGWCVVRALGFRTPL